MNKPAVRGESWGGGIRRAAWGVLAVAAIIVVMFGSELIRLYTDWLWFQDVGYRGVFTRTVAVKAGLMAVGALAFFAIVHSNLWLARRLTPRRRLYLDEQHQLRINIGEFGRWGLSVLLLVATAVLSLSAGMAAVRGWYDYILFCSPTRFGQSDPLFGRDIGFYLFRLPFLGYVYKWLITAVGLSFVGVAARYFFDRAIDFGTGQPRVALHARAHLSGLLGALLLLKAWGYMLARYSLPLTKHRLFVGASYTDVHVRLLALNVLIVLAVVAAVVLLVNIRLRNLRLPLVAIGAWLVVSFLGGGLLPAAVQKLQVTPNELTAEEPFIAHAIKATRAAFKLDRVRPRPFPAAGTLTMRDIRANDDTVRNIRLWDYEPLQESYQQIQTIRPYYVFNGVDVDRYRFPDGIRQVALSVRELSVSRLGAGQSSWINRHLIYTHGYGLCMSPVNRVARGGLPELIIKDLPPQTPPGLPLKRPQVYFGEITTDYVVVNSTEHEFDHPATGDQNVSTRYEGSRGVSVGSFWRRLVFSLRFGDQNILLSRHLTRQSRILYGRDIADRVRRIAPFLRLDRDPYPVVYDGRIVWIIDAYTTSRWYPYSEALQPDSMRFDDTFNYIRNAVKVTVDAYDGSVDLYIADPEDRIVRTLDRAFPGLFKPLERMPAGLRAHLRYPRDLFYYQASVYTKYHMTDPRVFYNREDVWQFPLRQQSEDDNRPMSPLMGSQPPLMNPYYMVMELPDGDSAEFILMLPFTPFSPSGDKHNMIAWMAGRSDGPHLGELVVHNFPKQKLVYGPAQIDALINQHTRISEKLSLWNQQGSRVRRAPVMVIPIDDSLLYVEPLYLQASNSQLPELKQVIVAYNGQVEMAETLEEGLTRLLAGETEPRATARERRGRAPSPPPMPTAAATADVRRLAREASDQFNRAQAALRRGDWSAWGEELERLRQTLTRLRSAAGE